MPANEKPPAMFRSPVPTAISRGVGTMRDCTARASSPAARLAVPALSAKRVAGVATTRGSPLYSLRLSPVIGIA